jgi:hypothetical protein
MEFIIEEILIKLLVNFVISKTHRFVNIVVLQQYPNKEIKEENKIEAHYVSHVAQIFIFISRDRIDS